MDKQHERWQEEAQFFDEWAEKAAESLTPLDPRVIARYKAPRRRYHKEYRFRLMGDLTGKKVLDVGCGDGVNAVLLASLGAQVMGIDVSPKAIQLAGERAKLNAVDSRTEFLCAPVETAPVPQATFDIIWGDAILHHVIADLDSVVAKLGSWLRPGGMMLFAEPVNFNRALRGFRMMLPVKTDATPDERPLERGEIEILRRRLPDLRLELFTMLGRLDRYVLPNYSYEDATSPRQALSDTMALIDYAVLRTPGLKSLAGTAVMYGHARSSK